MNIKTTLYIAAATVALTSCGSHKAVQDANGGTSGKPAATANAARQANDDRATIDFLDKVNENASYQKNIVASVTFTLYKNGGGTVSVPGQLRMRKDQVVRLSAQVPIIGSEAARIEFTRDHVLFIDRMHKEYVRADYAGIDFLRENGTDFYTLQSLFWNRLYLPGHQSVGYTDLGEFKAGISGNSAQVPVTLNSGKLAYTWTANRADGLISQTRIAYTGGTHGTSTVTWDYSDFKDFSSKKFPHTYTISITTPADGKARSIKLGIHINSISTSGDWEAETTVSDKYRQVSAEELLKKITRL